MVPRPQVLADESLIHSGTQKGKPVCLVSAFSNKLQLLLMLSEYGALQENRSPSSPGLGGDPDDPSKHHDNGIPWCRAASLSSVPGSDKEAWLPSAVGVGEWELGSGGCLQNWFRKLIPSKVPLHSRSLQPLQVKGSLWCGWPHYCLRQPMLNGGNLTPGEITNCCVCAHIHSWQFPWSAKVVFRDFCFTATLAAEWEVVLDHRGEAGEEQVQPPLPTQPHPNVLVLAPPRIPPWRSHIEATLTSPRCLYSVVNLTLNYQHIFLKEKYTGNPQKERKGILRLWYILWLLFWNGKAHEMTNVWPMFYLGLWGSQASTPHHPHTLHHQPARFIHPTTSSQPLSPKK